MSQKLPLNDFKWIEKTRLLNFNENFIKKYDEDSNTGYFYEVHGEHPKTLFSSHKDLPFLPKSKKVEKVGKLYCSREDKKNVIHMGALKQALNHGLKLKKVHRVIQVNQKAWLKTYIDVNTKYRKEAQNDFEKDFFKLMNNSVFGKTLENVRNHKDIKSVTSDKIRKRLVSEPNCHSHKKFSEHLMHIEIKKKKVKMIKRLYLGMPKLDISKTLMYKFWYDYIKPKYGDRARLCYTDTDSFVIHFITEDFFEDISNYVEKWFDTSNYDENDKRPFATGKSKKYQVFLKMN